jgi:HAD superfamily hydrolase (TIGR01549 family)
MDANEIKAVFFDFDGTLTSPGALDFPKIKRAIGGPPDIPILEYIDTLASDEEKNRARQILDTYEIEAAAASRPSDGCEKLLRVLKNRQLKIGIISRNSLKSIKKALDNFVDIGVADFDVIISRDSPAAVKPSPEGILLAAGELGLLPRQIIMVGDYVFDLRAGRTAGAYTVLIDIGGFRDEWNAEYDFCIDTLDELPGIIDLGTPLPPGKLPNALLGSFIDAVTFSDPSIIIGPGVGEDTAAVDIEGREVLILKSDPITFVAHDIGYYAVVINANDIATSGARPRWMLTTLLFPSGSTALQIHRTMLDIRNACTDLGISLCGGHTEITDAVTRPVVTGLMAGLVPRAGLLDKANLRPDDRILLTKQVAVEGTAILAAEFKERLLRLGVSQQTLKASEALLARLSILPEAGLAAGQPGAVALHDVTEGGLATALVELSCAAGYRLRIEMDNIPVFNQTRKLCRALDLNPLGLIGSGSLLIACRPKDAQPLRKRLAAANIEVADIGTVTGKGCGIEAVEGGQPAVWPEFAVDELARLFQ